MKSTPPTISTSRWELAGSSGETIFGVTDVLASPRTSAAGDVIICHGFKGYMDYGFLPRLASHLAEQGYRTHRFNFSHSGVTRDHDRFGRPDLFEKDTWSRQIHDLTVVVNHLQQTGRPLILFGHSRGGVTALLTAARLGAKIAAVITAASPADACTLDDSQIRRLRKNGKLSSPSGRTGQELFVGIDWLLDIEQDGSRHDPLMASRRASAQMFHIHGSADTTVSPEDLQRFAAADPKASTTLIENATHVFNAPNPMLPTQELPEATGELFTAVENGLKKFTADQANR